MAVPKQEVIDVDARIVVDLTKPISIDLTGDDDVQEASPPRRWPPQRTKVSYTSNGDAESSRWPGLNSSIHIRKPVSMEAKMLVPPRTRDMSQPPAKKRKTDSVTGRTLDKTTAIMVEDDDIPWIPFSARRACVSDLELDSDGDIIETKYKKLIRREDEDTDEESEEAYDRCHAGYDLNNSAIWKPFKNNVDKIVFNKEESLMHLGIAAKSTSESTAPQPPRPPRPRLFEQHIPHRDIFAKFGIKKKHSSGLVRWKFLPAPRHINTLTHAECMRRSALQNVIQPMKQVTSFKHAPGSINRIEQCGNFVAIASAATGGHPDDGPVGEIDPYNKEGSILVWNGKPEILQGHFRRKGPRASSAESTQPVKYYTVNDVKFDPCSSSLVSAGNDRTVHIWPVAHDEHSNDDRYGLEEPDIWSLPVSPTGLAFKPGSSVLAVAESLIYIFSDLSGSAATSQIPLSNKKNCSVGAMVWGHGPTANIVFASTEPLDPTKYVGHHKAVDAEASEVVYSFEETGAGDEISVTSDGSRLALIARREERIHTLRIFDVRRSDPKEQLSIELQPFPADIEGEVSSAAFSTDGNYLALGRNDNHTHVYDSRYLDRILFDYQHDGPPRTNPGKDSYGVVKVQWVDEDPIHPFGLVTGGNDGGVRLLVQDEPALNYVSPSSGCVRFWDPTRSATHPRNGTVLGEVTSDVATFSIGDRYKGEYPLVIGDGCGEISTFEFGPQGHHSVYR